jgi:microcin C transport system permease protein
MFAYVLKRLLLMLPTLLGVLLLTFVVIQFVPGGPVEQYLAEARAGTGGAGPRAAGWPIAARRGWTRSAWPRSASCTASTSPRPSASG